MISSKNVRFFGAEFIKNARDRPISTFDDFASGKIKSEIGTAINKSLSTFSSDDQKKIRDMFILAIDLSLFEFLTMLEEGAESMSLIIKNDNVESNILDGSDGLNGELFGDSGWIKSFSEYEIGYFK